MKHQKRIRIYKGLMRPIVTYAALRAEESKIKRKVKTAEISS